MKNDKRQIDHVKIIFENCDFARIEGDDILFGSMDYQKSRKFQGNSFTETNLITFVDIVIAKKASIMKTNEGEPLFERIMEYPDITAFEFYHKAHDEQEEAVEEFHVDWVDYDGEVNQGEDNPAVQSSSIYGNGNLYLVIKSGCRLISIPSKIE